MDRAKFEKAVEIREKITELHELASDLQSVNCIDFLIRRECLDRRISALWKDGNETSDIFDVVIGNVLAEIEDRLKTLENEFDNL